MYNTTIYNTYKSEAERKNICQINNLIYCNDGKTISFSVNYKDMEFKVTSCQNNRYQIGILVTWWGEYPIDFVETLDPRCQSFKNLQCAMDEILRRIDLAEKERAYFEEKDKECDFDNTHFNDCTYFDK